MKQHISEHLRLMVRGLRVLHKMSPWNMAVKIIRSFCSAAQLYVNLFLSAEIVDALIAKKPTKELILLVVLSVVLNTALSLLSHWMDTMNDVKWHRFYLKYNMSIGLKAMSLDYSEIEDPETHRKMKNIDDAMKISNYGLIKLHSRIPLFFQHFFSILFSLAFTLSGILKKGGGNGIVGFANSVYADILLIVCVVVVCVMCVVGNGKISTASYSLLGALSKINRVFDFYLNQYLEGHKAGKDVRLYKQGGLFQMRSAFSTGSRMPL